MSRASDAKTLNASERQLLAHTLVIGWSPRHDTQEEISEIQGLASAYLLLFEAARPEICKSEHS